LAPLIIQTIQFTGDYSTVISDLSQFLQACSEVLTPVTCYYAQPEMGNIEVSFQGTDSELTEAIAKINRQGELQINGYPSLPVISSTTSIASTQDSTTDKPTSLRTTMESTTVLPTVESTTVLPTVESTNDADSTILPSKDIEVVKMEITFSGLTSAKFGEAKDTIKKVVADAGGVEKSAVAVALMSRRTRRVLQTSVVEATITADNVDSVQQSLLSTNVETFQENFAREAEQAGLTGISLEGVSEPVISSQPIDDSTSDAPESTTEVTSQEPESSNEENPNTQEESEKTDSEFIDLLIMILAGVTGALLLCVCSYCIYIKCLVRSYKTRTFDTYDFNNYSVPTQQNDSGWFVTKRRPEEHAQLYAL